VNGGLQMSAGFVVGGGAGAEGGAAGRTPVLGTVVAADDVEAEVSGEAAAALAAGLDEACVAIAAALGSVGVTVGEAAAVVVCAAADRAAAGAVEGLLDP
jgi:hypothetical protein